MPSEGRFHVYQCIYNYIQVTDLALPFLCVPLLNTKHVLSIMYMETVFFAYDMWQNEGIWVRKTHQNSSL